MDSSWAYLGIAVFLFIVFMVVSFKSNKTKKLRIVTAETDKDGHLVVFEVTRQWKDGWNDVKDMKCYHLGNKRVWLPVHWIIRIEEL